jgi:hypothetical protein
MRRLARLAGAILLFALGQSGEARAHTLSESHSLWEIRGKNVDMVMTIPARELQRLGKNGDMPADNAVIRYLSGRVYPIAAGARCSLVPPVEPLSATTGFRKYDFTFECPSAKDLRIRFDAFFDLVTSHTDFAEIQDAATGELAEQLITNANHTVSISGDNRLNTASFWEFIGMGIMHIFTGVDHMSFLLGLVLISKRLRDLVFVVSGFTIGHSLTLALAVTGVIRPQPEYIDALVALTIALIGAENLGAQTRQPAPFALALGGALLLMAVGSWLGFGGLPSLLLLGAGLFTANYLMISGQLADAGRLRMVVTLTFGLIHGFGFASNLLEMQLPTNRLAELLLGFNLGVEIGQLTLVVGVTLLVWLLMRLKFTIPRPIVVDVASAFLIGIGAFWFVTRSYG